jgi:hypothetical protein
MAYIFYNNILINCPYYITNYTHRNASTERLSLSPLRFFLSVLCGTALSRRAHDVVSPTGLTAEPLRSV